MLLLLLCYCVVTFWLCVTPKSHINELLESRVSGLSPRAFAFQSLTWFDEEAYYHGVRMCEIYDL